MTSTEARLNEYLQKYVHIHNRTPEWFTKIVLSSTPRQRLYQFKGILNGRGNLIQKFYDVYNASTQQNSWGAGQTYLQRIAAASKKVNVDALGRAIHSKIVSQSNPIHFDFGSGDGTTALALSSVIRAKQTYCVDVGDYMLAENKEHCKFTVIDPVSPLTIPSGVNVITTSHVFHHLSSYDMIRSRIAEMYNALPNGGLLLVREHDVAYNATSKIDERLRQYNAEVVILMHLCYEINEIPRGKTLREFTTWFEGMPATMNLMTADQLIQFCAGDGTDINLDGSKITNNDPVALGTRATSNGFVVVASTQPRDSDLSYYVLFEKKHADCDILPKKLFIEDADAIETYNNNYAQGKPITAFSNVQYKIICNYNWFANVENCGYHRMNRNDNSIKDAEQAYVDHTDTRKDVESVKFWMDKYKSGDIGPRPIIVSKNDTLIMVDGVHRTVAASIVGIPTIVAIAKV